MSDLSQANLAVSGYGESNIQRYRDELRAVIELGNQMISDMFTEDERGRNVPKKTTDLLSNSYHLWYTEAHAVVKQIIPDRLMDFEQLYEGEGRRTQLTTATFTIRDWLNGLSLPQDRSKDGRPSAMGAMAMRFSNQLGILKSAEARFDSSLFDIRQLVQADLLDSEIAIARELIKNGFLRAAGAVAGVALEKHLSQVLDNHNIKTRKKSPTISDFNDQLKNDEVLDVPSWRQIQRLGDIRNLCTHNKHREPTTEEVEELIDGVDKYMKVLF